MALNEIEIEVVVFSVLLFIATVLFCFRMYVRIYCYGPVTSIRTYRSSELLVMFAWLNYVYQTWNTSFLNLKGWDGAPDYKEWVVKVDFWASLMYQPMLYAIKAAMLLYYIELSPKSVNRRLWYAFMVTWLLLAWGFFVTVGMRLFGCLPLSLNWSKHAGFGRPCKIKNNFWIVTFIPHIITEIVIIALPFFILKQLRNIERSKLLAAMIMFSLAFINFIALAFLWGETLQTLYSKDHRLSFQGAWHYTWIIQPFTAVSVACIPFVRRTWVDFNEWRTRKRDGTQRPRLFKSGVFSTIRRPERHADTTGATANTATTMATDPEVQESPMYNNNEKDLEVGVHPVNSTISQASNST